MSEVVDLNAKRSPVCYVVRIIHHWDGFIEFCIEDVADDPRSRASVLNMMQRVSGIQEASDAMHAYILRRINSLMDTTNPQELQMLSEMADLAQAYEEKRFPLV
jgi:hypothetical protein